MGQPNMKPPDFKTLKNKQRKLRGGFPQDMSLRVHRAISWGLRAEKEVNDFDAGFLLLWIGFNAAYAKDSNARIDGERGSEERRAFRNYFKDLVPLDDGTLYDAVWKEEFLVKNFLLVEDKFLYEAFWKFRAGKGHENWQIGLEQDKRFFLKAQACSNAQKKRATAKILFIIFCRLYVLRNQLMHGGATWNSRLNRTTVRRGATIMKRMLPVFINLMMDNPHEDWGKPWFIPVDK